MAIDFSPLANMRPVNLAEIYGAADQANAQKQAMQFQQMQIARQTKADQENDAVKGSYVVKPDGTLDEQGTFANLYKVAPQKAMELQQQISQQKMAQAKAAREEQDSKLSQAEKIVNLKKESSKAVLANPTLETAMRETQLFGQQTGTDVSKDLEYLQQIGDNKNAIMKWAAGHALDASNFVIKPQNQDIGGSLRSVSYDPVTGEQKILSETAKTATPDAIMTDKRTREEGAANRNVTIRGQNLTDARSKEANGVKLNEKVPENSTSIRKEFDQLPEVKNYKQALPAYQAIEDAAKRNSTQSDINIVYGLAKLYDPNSVVREGEYATVANSPNIPERLKGQMQYLAGGGRLTEETKKQILQEARGRFGTFENQYSTARTNYTDIAKRSNADPSLVFPSEYKSAIQKDSSSFNAMPKPNAYVGKTILDESTGVKYKSDGKNWVKVQ